MTTRTQREPAAIDNVATLRYLARCAASLSLTGLDQPEIGRALSEAADEIERLRRTKSAADAFERSVSEALNSGDGSYRP